MRAVDIIGKKRDGHALSDGELGWFIANYATGAIPDYQASALLMAIYLQGMSDRETAALTEAMVRSGDQLDLSRFGRVVDKHSSGGVGDKTTLVVGPIVASTGLPVAKMSGRGLGFTGGTLDKLESIPGFRSDLSFEQFMDQVEAVGLVVAGATKRIAPADKQLYALRDVTATVGSLPLIASSIMSKKLASGADAIVLDVKVGNGAFMETVAEAEALAERMVAIGETMGRDVVALLTDMGQPLGHAVGNALELREAIATLHGDGPADFTTLCVEVAAQMLRLGHKADTLEAARALATDQLRRGAAWATFRAMVAAQGGDVRFIDDPEALPVAPVIEEIAAPRRGWIAGIDAREVGLTVVEMGGGRAKKDDAIDHAVGVVFAAKVGDWIDEGTTLFTLHSADEPRHHAAQQRLLAAYTWSERAVDAPPLVWGVVGDGRG